MTTSQSLRKCSIIRRTWLNHDDDDDDDDDYILLPFRRSITLLDAEKSAKKDPEVSCPISGDERDNDPLTQTFMRRQLGWDVIVRRLSR